MSEIKPAEEHSDKEAPPAAAKKSMSEIEVLIRARYPLLYVVTWEEQRVMSQVSRIASRLDKRVFEWSVTTGLVPEGTAPQSQQHRDTSTQDPLVALDTVLDHVDPAIYVFKDFHPFMVRHNMAIIRRLREMAVSLRNTFKTVILVSPMFEIPAELEKDLTVIDFDMPKGNDLGILLDRIVDEVKENPKLSVNITPPVREKIVHALLGLTLLEAENVLAKTLVQHRCLSEKSVDIILGEKKQIIRKNGLLEYYETHENIGSIGGLDVLKDWLKKRAIAFSDRARSFGLPAPRGVLLLGVQGCGKSLMAKAVSQLWHLPLLRFDVGKVFGSLVGTSEENIRRAIMTAESIAPAVLWIDEIDKAFRESRGSTDGGTSARVFATFLTWLSDKQSPVFVVATCNSISQLPPELLRKGRFDEIFFVDLPTRKEREEIFKIHLTKRRQEPSNFDLAKLAEASIGFSGAEIEESIISSLFDAFYEQRPVCTEDILRTIQQTAPLSKTMSEDVAELRKWAEGRARMGASPEQRVGAIADKKNMVDV